MRFEERLAQESVPEWRSRYVPYGKLKRLVDETKEQILDAVRERREALGGKAEALTERDEATLSSLFSDSAKRDKRGKEKRASGKGDDVGTRAQAYRMKSSVPSVVGLPERRILKGPQQSVFDLLSAVPAFINIQLHASGLANEAPDAVTADGSNNLRIELSRLAAERQFWQTFDRGLRAVEEFYELRMKENLEMFHALAMEAVALGLIDYYVPRQKERISRIAREVARETVGSLTVEIAAPSAIEIGVHGDIVATDMYALPSGDYPICIVAPVEEFERLPIARKKDGGAKRQAALRQQFQCKVDGRYTLLEVPVKPQFIHEAKKRNRPTWKDRIRPSMCYGTPASVVKLRDGIREYYRGLVLLEQYCLLNLEAVRKIAKKHDKELGTQIQASLFDLTKNKSDFGKQVELKLLMAETEHLFATALCKGHRTNAMNSLRVPDPSSSGSSFFSLGAFLGILITLMLALFYIIFGSLSAADRSWMGLQAHDGNTRAYLVAYRSLLMGVLLAYIWGIDLYIWQTYRINYIFIMGLDPRRNVRYHHVFRAASIFLVLWTLSLFLFVLSSLPSVPGGLSWLTEGKTGGSAVSPAIWPLTVAALYCVVLIVEQFRRDGWLVRTFGRIIAAPFVSVEFRDFFLADSLLSVTITLYDLFFSVCFFTHDIFKDYQPETGSEFTLEDIKNRDCFKANLVARPVLACLPVTWRVLQCLRRYYDDRDSLQLWNTAKYSTSYLVILTAYLYNQVNTNFLTLWLVCILLSSGYSFYWDVVNDWSFTSVSFKPSFAMTFRQTRLLPSMAYYLSVPANLLLRLLWTLTISPRIIPLDPLIVETVLSFAEIFRRGQWNVYRLENEQVNNIGKFRATKHIPLLLPEKTQQFLRRHGLVPARPGDDLNEQSDSGESSADIALATIADSSSDNDAASEGSLGNAGASESIDLSSRSLTRSVSPSKLHKTAKKRRTPRNQPDQVDLDKNSVQDALEFVTLEKTKKEASREHLTSSSTVSSSSEERRARPISSSGSSSAATSELSE